MNQLEQIGALVLLRDSLYWLRKSAQIYVGVYCAGCGAGTDYQKNPHNAGCPLEQLISTIETVIEEKRIAP